MADTACSTRTMGDVAADGNPSTGVAIYDTYPNPYGETGWISQVGGDSLASAIVAGVYALAGNGTTVKYASYPYAHTNDLFDITQGSNLPGAQGQCVPPQADKYLCFARKGYDGPSGLGTPNGYTGF